MQSLAGKRALVLCSFNQLSCTSHSRFVFILGQTTKNHVKNSIRFKHDIAKLWNTPKLGITKRLPSKITLVQPKRAWHPGHGSSDILPENMLDRRTESNWSMIRKLWGYIWPSDRPDIRKRVVIAVSLLVGSKLLNVAVPFIFGAIVDLLNKNAGTPLTTSPESAAAGLSIILAMVIGYGVVRVGSSFLSELRNAVFARVAHDSIRRVARKVFLHLHNMDLAFHLSRQTGILSKSIDRGSRGINFILSALVFNVAPTIFEVALVSSILYYKCGGQFALVSIGCIASYAAFTLAVTQWRTKFRIAMNKAENEAGAHSVDSMINYETVKFFNKELYETERYDKALKKYEDASLKTTTSLAFLNFGQNLIFSASLSGIMMLAAYGILDGSLSVGDLVVVNGLLFQLSLPLNFLGSVYREIRQSLVDMQNMFGILSLQTSVKSKPNAPMVNIRAENSNIVFDDVTFSYAELKGLPIIQNLNLEVPSGQKVAIVGGSGSGKSTIVRLMYRFFDPITGRILVDGKDIRDVNLESYRRAISVVPQDTVLFNNTIEYNMHYANLDRPVEDVYEAAKMAELHDTITRWPNGYLTQVGERGLKLSGGEKQRVAITRAILKDAPILIFDEATSSLDSITEQKIMRALSRASKGRTTIIIAHRLSTVVDADQIFVLDQGKVIESGTHLSLVAKPSSLYAQLWRKQHEADRNLRQP